MNQQNVLALNINSEAFNAMKEDFNKILKRTLSNMEMKDSDAAEMTVKLKITLTKDEAPDFDIVAYQATREVIKPSFTHKVSSVMQIKDEESGFLKGDYELVWDKELGDYVMKPIENSQRSFFDDKTRDSDVEYVEAEVIEPAALEGRKVMLTDGTEPNADEEFDYEEGEQDENIDG